MNIYYPSFNDNKRWTSLSGSDSKVFVQYTKQKDVNKGEYNTRLNTMIRGDYDLVGLDVSLGASF